MPSADDRVIQGLWVGNALSTMERLSIASFLAHGHEYHLYSYGPVAGVPPGTLLKDAREVLPESSVFLYRDHRSYAGFANFFRYKLLSERGGWWVDTDTVCVRPLDVPGIHAFGSEQTRGGGVVPSAGLIKAPAGSPAMAFAWDECRARDPRLLTWGETGSRLVAEAVRRFNLDACVLGWSVFAPIPFFEWQRVLDPLAPDSFPAATQAVHLWNEMWRRDGRDKDASYPPGCLFERWKARYLATSPS